MCRLPQAAIRTHLSEMDPFTQRLAMNADFIELQHPADQGGKSRELL